jgi:hypothetical protein
MADFSLFCAQLASEKRSRDGLASEASRLAAEKRSRDEEVIVIPRPPFVHSASSHRDLLMETFTDSNRKHFFDGGFVQVMRLEARLEAEKKSR